MDRKSERIKWLNQPLDPSDQRDRSPTGANQYQGGKGVIH
jgi:hypothetical protein